MMTPSRIATTLTPPTSAYDHASGWLELTNRLRTRLDTLRCQTKGTPLEQEMELLAKDARKLCDHMELLHQETARWLAETDQSAAEGEGAWKDLNSLDIQRAAVTIQREQHEQSRNPMEIIKALLMWVETPEEHVGNAPANPPQP